MHFENRSFQNEIIYASEVEPAAGCAILILSPPRLSERPVIDEDAAPPYLLITR